MDTLDDTTTLKQDAALEEPLRRVAYEAGMMLGLEATRDEQAYHRRRLNRHQYWLQGHGTLAGMRVAKNPDSHANSVDDIDVRLEVKPGIGIDRLGREILIHETYCMELGQWLAVQEESYLREGYDDPADKLWLKLYVRQKDCPVAQQPVLARKLNLSTDAVQPARTADSIILELIPDKEAPDNSSFQPWGNHKPIEDADKDIATAPLSLSAAEEAEISGAATAEAAAQLTLQARLLHAFDAPGVGVTDPDDSNEAKARLLLAHISIEVADISSIVVNPEKISINNLVRPFLANADQLAWLARQP